MRARTLDVPLPAAVVLKRRRLPRKAIGWTLEAVLLLALGFGVFAFLHRARAHSDGASECCATSKAR